MSEYQYYEFRTIDRSLTPEHMSELRALSSRAEITPNSFTNTYNYGDFRGNPRKLMESYFDAHVYVSNFGSLTFLLRLPQSVIPEDTLALYAVEDSLDWWTTDEYTIVDWQLNEDEGGDWMDGEGWMDRLLPLRDELVRGDYRSLYIGWLSSIANNSLEEDEDGEWEFIGGSDSDDDLEEDDEEEEDDVPNSRRKEPPVPAGLGSPTVAQLALAEFLGVGRDLIAAAAEASARISKDANSAEKVTEWVAHLPEPEVRALLERIIHGEAMRVQTELQSRFYRSDGDASEDSRSKSGGSRRTAAELLTKAEELESERKLQEQKERDRKRTAHLAGLVPRFSELWAEVNALAEEQKAAPYDRATALLVDMRAAYAQAGRRPEFDAEFAQYLGRYSRSAAFVRRLKEAKLMS